MLASVQAIDECKSYSYIHEKDREIKTRRYGGLANVSPEYMWSFWHSFFAHIHSADREQK